MTPSPSLSDGHNEYLRTIPDHVKELLFTVKRYHRPEWGDDWRSGALTDDEILSLLFQLNQKRTAR